MDDDSSKKDPVVLMRQAKDGDADAFSRLYELYFTPVFRYIYLRVRNKDETDDLIQTVFLKVFQSIGRWQEKKPPLAYFFTIARNTVIDYWRKKKEIKIDDPEKIFNQIPDDAATPQELLEKADVAKIVRCAIQSLIGEQQDVIILKFINDLPNKEIAELLGKTEGAIRQLQCRALKALREFYKNQ